MFGQSSRSLAPEHAVSDVQTNFSLKAGYALLFAAVVLSSAHEPVAADDAAVKNFAAGYAAFAKPSSLFMERLGAMASRLHEAPAAESLIEQRETRQAALELAGRFSDPTPAAEPSGRSAATTTPAADEAQQPIETQAVTTATIGSRADQQQQASLPAQSSSLRGPMGLGAPLPVEDTATAPAPASTEQPAAVAAPPAARPLVPTLDKAKRRDASIQLADRGVRGPSEVLPWRRSRSADALGQYLTSPAGECTEIVAPPCVRKGGSCAC